MVHKAQDFPAANALRRQDMHHRYFFAFTVLIILCVFFCFEEGSASEPSWSTTHKGKNVECSVDYPALIPGLISLAWNNFSVSYTTQANGEKYVWTYNCGKQVRTRSINDCSHACGLIDNVSSLSLPSDFDPDSSVQVDLKPGTSNAQVKVCREIFNKSNP